MSRIAKKTFASESNYSSTEAHRPARTVAIVAECGRGIVYRLHCRCLLNLMSPAMTDVNNRTATNSQKIDQLFKSRAMTPATRTVPRMDAALSLSFAFDIPRFSSSGIGVMREASVDGRYPLQRRQCVSRKSHMEHPQPGR